MKRFIIYVLAAVITLSVSSCYTSGRHQHGHLHTGKAKKVYGNKSAKRHAPVQKKKKHKKNKKSKPHKHDAYYSPIHRH